MNHAIQDALDDLASFRSSTTRQGRALDALERLLADICVPGDAESQEALQLFIALQDTFQCNVPSRLLVWISDASSRLDSLTQKGSIAHEHEKDVATLSAQLTQALSIIQGVVLNHEPSKQYLGRRFALEVLVDLFLVARHANPLADENKNPAESKPKEKTPPAVTIAGVVLDTLLCIMVDSSPALRAFEDVNGVRSVVKILKRAGTPRETRMKCLEFLYFYLMDETVSTFHDIPDLTRTPSKAIGIPTAPNSPVGRPRSGSALSISQSSDSSVSSQFSSCSASSVSSSATSVSSEDSPETSPLAPSPIIFSKSKHSRSSSTAHPRISPFPLRKDLDSTPQTPRSKIGLGTPRALQSHLKQRQSQACDDGDSDDAHSILSKLDEFKTPKRGLQRSQVSSHGQLNFETPAPSSRTHRRAQSTIDIRPGISSPKSPLSPERFSFFGSGPTALSGGNINMVSPRRTTQRTMEEKKKILGSMMGNVDALVEGVKKAGIWGLA